MSDDGLGVVKFGAVDKLDGAYCILFVLFDTSGRFFSVDVEQKSLPTMLAILPGFGVISMRTGRGLSTSTMLSGSVSLFSSEITSCSF